MRNEWCNASSGLILFDPSNFNIFLSKSLPLKSSSGMPIAFSNNYSIFSMHLICFSLILALSLQFAANTPVVIISRVGSLSDGTLHFMLMPMGHPSTISRNNTPRLNMSCEWSKFLASMPWSLTRCSGGEYSGVATCEEKNDCYADEFMYETPKSINFNSLICLLTLS